MANYACGTGVPTRCATTSVSIGPGSTIYGDVCANNQTSGSRMSQGGLIVGCEVTPSDVNVTQLMFDKASFTGKMPTPQAASTGNCVNNGSCTWPANTRYGGNVTIGDECALSVRGDVYITGNLTIDVFAEIRVHNSVSTTPPTIVVNGRVTMGENVQVIPNADRAGVRIISFYSTDNNATTGCTYSDSCVTLSNAAHMRNSLSTRAISVGNEAVLSKSLVWAYFGEAYIDWGSEGDSEDGIGAVIGQKVTIEEGVKIGYMNEKGGSAQPVMHQSAPVQRAALQARMAYGRQSTTVESTTSAAVVYSKNIWLRLFSSTTSRLPD